jgi:hypothetical protein
MDLTTENAEPRIYVVVAETIQTPLRVGDIQQTTTKRWDTRYIVQPAGRMAAQAAHAVSQVRVAMVEMKVREAIQKGHFSRRQTVQLVQDIQFHPITTIVLAARDSFELNHVLNLLYTARISVEEFADTNPEAYGPGDVTTAVATWPVQPNEVLGILDYLPLALREG